MFGFFSTIFGDELILPSFILIVGEILMIMIFKLVNSTGMKYMHDDIDDEDEDDDLNNFSLEQE